MNKTTKNLLIVLGVVVTAKAALAGSIVYANRYYERITTETSVNMVDERDDREILGTA